MTETSGCNNVARAAAGTSSNNTAALQQKLKQMEEEIIKLRTQQLHLAKRAVKTNTATLRTTPVSNPDARSVLVQNVHFTATPQIVAAHFSGCALLPVC